MNLDPENQYLFTHGSKVWLTALLRCRDGTQALPMCRAEIALSVIRLPRIVD